jgi:phage replication O-like protein O
MANPPLKKGFTLTPNEIYDAMLRSGLRGADALVVFAIGRLTYGWNKKEAEISYSRLAELTNLSLRTVEYAVSNLEAKRMITVKRRRGRGIKNKPNIIAIQEDYSIWKPEEKSPQYRKLLKQLKESYASNVKCSDLVVQGNVNASSNQPESLSNTQIKSADLVVQRNVSSAKNGTFSSAKNGGLVVQTFAPIKDIKKDSKSKDKKKERLTAFSSEELSSDSNGCRCPHSEIVDLYHRMLPELPKIVDWGAERQKSLRGRWNSKAECRDLKWWEGFFTRVKKSDFLMGRKNDFMANLPWLIKAANFSKVIDGNYSNQGGQSAGKPEWLKELEEHRRQQRLEAEGGTEDGTV